MALTFVQLSFLIKVSIKFARGFTLVDALHRIRLILYIPTKRIFYHFDSKSVYFTAKTVRIHDLGGKMVGLTGFEPATSRSRTERSTKLSHNPLCFALSNGIKPSNICRSMLPLQLAGSGEASPTFCLSCGGNCVGSFLGLAKCKRAAT